MTHACPPYAGGATAGVGAAMAGVGAATAGVGAAMAGVGAATPRKRGVGILHVASTLRKGTLRHVYVARRNGGPTSGAALIGRC